MTVANIEIEIYCATCGDGLCNQTDFVETKTRGYPSFRVKACERCVKEAFEEGKESGYDAGYEAARKEFEK